MEEIKFAWIVFCFMLSLIIIPFSYSRYFAVHISAALFLTVISDYFLLLRQNYLAGLSLFCLVQICYIALAVGFAKIKIILGYILTYAVLIFFLKLDALIMAALLYVVLFFMNISFSLWAVTRMNRANGALFITGLMLFALCDINVLIFNLKNYVAAAEIFSAAALPLIWIFYTPAQFLLALSGLKFPEREVQEVGE